MYHSSRSRPLNRAARPLWAYWHSLPSHPAAGAASLPSLEATADAAAAEYTGPSWGGANDGANGGLDSGSGGAGVAEGEWFCGAYVAPEGTYCQRANTLQGYADVNRCASQSAERS